MADVPFGAEAELHTAEHALELSIEFSHGPSQPYLLRTYQVRNGHRTKVAYSQTYADRDQVREAADALRRGLVRYGMLLGSDGRYLWQAVTGADVVATSLHGFSSLVRARSQMELVRSHVAAATITDATLRGEATDRHPRTA